MNIVDESRRGTSFSVIAVVMASVVLVACDSGSNGSAAVTGVIDPKQSEELAQALTLKLNGTVVEREEEQELPPPSDDAASPQVTAPQNDEVQPGEGKSVVVQTQQNTPLSVLYAKVAGSNSRFKAVLSEASSRTKQTSDSIEFLIEIPANLGAGQFCIEFAAEDSAGLVSEPDTTCLTYTPEGNEPEAIRAILQGTWMRCADGFVERLSFEDSTFNVDVLEYENPDCSGRSVSAFRRVNEFSLGEPFLSDTGLTVNPLDGITLESTFPSEVNASFPEIVFIPEDQDDVFRLSDEYAQVSEDRPTTVDFERPPYRRLPADANAWELTYVVTTMTAQGGDPQTDSVGPVEVGEEFVPMMGPATPEELTQEIDFVTNYERGFQQQQICDAYSGDVSIADASFSRDGEGEVGTVISLFVDFFIDGTCTVDGQSQPLDLDAEIDYSWERIS